MHDGDCFECPTGAVCDTPGSTLTDLTIAPGFFRFTPSSTEIYECHKALDCVGGNVTGTQLCSKQASGLLCSACQRGYYVRDAIAACTLCGDVNDLWWLGPAIFIFLVTVAAIAAYVKRSFIRDWFKRNSDWLRKSSRDISARLVAVFVNMQIIVLIQSNHDELGGQPTPSVHSYPHLPSLFLFKSLPVPFSHLPALSGLCGALPDPQLGPYTNDACGLHGRERLELL